MHAILTSANMKIKRKELHPKKKNRNPKNHKIMLMNLDRHKVVGILKEKRLPVLQSRG